MKSVASRYRIQGGYGDINGGVQGNGGGGHASRHDVNKGVHRVQG